eukprot:3037547-Rhodomonas_salina.1
MRKPLERSAQQRVQADLAENNACSFVNTHVYVEYGSRLRPESTAAAGTQLQVGVQGLKPVNRARMPSPRSLSLSLSFSSLSLFLSLSLSRVTLLLSYSRIAHLLRAELALDPLGLLDLDARLGAQVVQRLLELVDGRVRDLLQLVLRNACRHLLLQHCRIHLDALQQHPQ